MEERICADCGKRFVLNDLETQFFIDRGLDIPKRCKNCIKENNGEAVTYVHIGEEHDGVTFPYVTTTKFRVETVKERNGCVFAFFFFLLIISLLMTVIVGHYERLSSYFFIPIDMFLLIPSIIFSFPMKHKKRIPYEEIIYGKENLSSSIVISENDVFDDSMYEYTFYSAETLVEHFNKHHEDTNCKNIIEYLDKANWVVNNPKARVKEKKDNGDIIYYVVSTNDYVVVAKAGYIRSYYKSTREHFLRQ